MREKLIGGTLGSSPALVQYNIISKISEITVASSLSRTCAPRVFLCARFDSSSSPSHPFPSFFLSFALPPSPLGGKNPFCLRRRSLPLVFVRLVQPSSAHNGMSVGRSSSSSSSTHRLMFDRQVCSFPRSPARRAVQASEDIHFGVIFACFSDSQIRFASAILGTLGS